MQPIAITVMVVYLVAVTLIGMAFARRAATARQWAVGGSTMGVLMIAVGVAGTRIGAGGTYGVAGDVIAGGVWNMWWYGISTFLALALVGLFFAIPYRRLHLQTVGEIFTIRYGLRRNQVLTSLCVQTEYIIVNIIEAYVIGVMIVGLSDGRVPMVIAVFIAAAVLISYVTVGGLWGAAVTNLIHCTVIVFGLLTIGILGINDIGGWEVVRSRVDAELAATDRAPQVWWAFMGAGAIPVVAMVFSAVIHTPAASVYTNFATAARTERVIIPGFLLAGLIAMAMPFLAGLIGILTLAKYGAGAGIRRYENITRLATDINPLIGGLALAAVLAAVISSGGPILLSSATMFVRDWLPHTRDYPSDHKLRLYRITTVIYGVLAAILAWGMSYTEITVLELLLFGFAMVVPPAIAIGYLIYWRGATEAGAYWGMATGYAGGLIWFGIAEFLVRREATLGPPTNDFANLLHKLFVVDGNAVDPSYASTLIPLIVVPLVSAFTRVPDPKADEFYAIVQGKKSLDETALGT